MNKLDPEMRSRIKRGAVVDLGIQSSTAVSPYRPLNTNGTMCYITICAECLCFFLLKCLKWVTVNRQAPCHPFQYIKVLYLRSPFFFFLVDYSVPPAPFFLFPGWVVWINWNKIVGPVGTSSRGSFSSIGANHRVHYMRIISVEELG